MDRKIKVTSSNKQKKRELNDEVLNAEVRGQSTDVDRLVFGRSFRLLFKIINFFVHKYLKQQRNRINCMRKR